MAITSEDIQNQSFSIDRKGYDVDEVDVFLEHVANEIDALNDEIADLQDQLEEARSASAADKTVMMGAVGGSAGGASHAADTRGFDDKDEDFGEAGSQTSKEYEAALAEKDSIIEDLQKQLDEKQADGSAISQALIVAQRSADEIIIKANAQASETMQDARDEADRIVSRANMNKQEVMDAIRKLEDDREDARSEYADLLRDFIDDATNKLNELGFDDDISAIPSADEVGLAYAEDDIAFNGARGGLETMSVFDENVDVPHASVTEKDLSGFGDVAEDLGDLD